MKKVLVIAFLTFISILACTNRDGEIIDLINSVKKQNDDLKAQISALKKTTDSALIAVLKVNSLQATTDRKIDIIQTDLKSLLSQIASLSTQMTAANADLASLKAKIDALQAKISELVAQIALLNTSNFSTVTSKTGRIWMDRNLGATQVATSPTDEKSYGYYYQWGRGNDGHQLPNSGTTYIKSQSDQPGNALFILVPGDDNGPIQKDWRVTPNPNLWQGINGVNNVCPTGFRLPTEQEWIEEKNTWVPSTRIGAYNSVLKLPLAGGRVAEYGNVITDGNGRYWTSTLRNNRSWVMGLNESFNDIASIPRPYGVPVRCIKAEITPKIGDQYGGGIVFYVDPTTSKGLVVTKENVRDGSTEWGCYCQDIKNTKTEVGSGQNNTKEMLAQCIASQNISNWSAKIVNNLVEGGFDDWYLPSKDELNLIYQNLHLKGSGNFSKTIPYWSSTQASYGSCGPSGGGWSQNFGNGQQIQEIKSGYAGTGAVRAIRSF